MSKIIVKPSTIIGHASPPPSKSAAHRALICAALAGKGSVSGVINSEDMRATLGGISCLGIKSSFNNNTIYLDKSMSINDHPIIDCMESGSTLRFLIPVFAALGIECTFIGRGRLPYRPLEVYADCLPKNGVSLSSEKGLPLSIKGKLEAGIYELPGNVSSQFISGLLFALPLLTGDSEIILTTPLESASYVKLTIDSLCNAGIVIRTTDKGWMIPGNQTYHAYDYTIEGDWSQAAFLIAMGTLGGEITIKGVNLKSHQGDLAILKIMQHYGADIRQTSNGIVCRRKNLSGISIDASQIPDLVPVLATVGALAKGVTTITGAARLRIKESDRLNAITDCLNSLGGRVQQTDDGLIIKGVDSFTGGTLLNGYNDHRIVMSMTVAALRCKHPIEIGDAQSITKSWPEFFDIYNSCGGEANVI